jgi:hypothetical protein
MKGAFEAHFIRVRAGLWRCFALNNTQVAGVDTGSELGFPFRLFSLWGLLKAPEDAAKEAEDAAGVALGWRETAQQQTEIVAVGRLHGARGVAGGEHGFFDEAGEQVEAR